MSKYGTDIPIVYIGPGEMHISEKPVIVSTVLGSCVSVTMFNKRSNIGAICHGFLPRCKCKDNCCGNPQKCIFKSGCSGICEESFRYVDCSIVNMLKRFQSLGIESKELDIKLFGGANVIATENKNSSLIVGTQNVKQALYSIESESLSLLVSDVGGREGRKIQFFTHTGDILLKRLRRIPARYRKQI
jgi:chemotaxis protein CheD